MKNTGNDSASIIKSETVIRWSRDAIRIKDLAVNITIRVYRQIKEAKSRNCRDNIVVKP
jgi:hypothetical protein